MLDNISVICTDQGRIHQGYSTLTLSSVEFCSFHTLLSLYWLLAVVQEVHNPLVLWFQGKPSQRGCPLSRNKSVQNLQISNIWSHLPNFDRSEVMSQNSIWKNSLFEIVTGCEINFFFSDSHLAPKFFKEVANSKVGHYFQRQSKPFFYIVSILDRPSKIKLGKRSLMCHKEDTRMDDIKHSSSPVIMSVKNHCSVGIIMWRYHPKKVFTYPCSSFDCLINGIFRHAY